MILSFFSDLCAFAPVRGAARARRRLEEQFIGIKQHICVDTVGLVQDNCSMGLLGVYKITDFINLTA